MDKRILASLMVVASFGSFPSSAQVPKASLIRAIDAAEAAYKVNYSKSVIPHWETETWTADDSAYKASRNSIFHEIMDNRSQSAATAAALVSRYQEEVNARPSDPMAVFQFAYASFTAARLDTNPGPQRIGRLSKIQAMLDGLPPQHNYELARLYFLVSGENQSIFNVKLLGERLLRRNLDDVSVEAYLVPMLYPGLVPTETTLALLLVRKMLLRSPNDPYATSISALVYYDCWLGHHQRSDGEAAIAAYRKYLTMLPANSPQRSQVLGIIQQIQQKMD